jgi:undecaprenyl-diphosphatase
MVLIELLKAVCLGFVEGITEWLPISSTGHMILVEEFIQLNSSDAFKEMFFVVIQLGAILAVVWLYFNKLNPFDRKKTESERKESLSIWYKVIVGCIPAVILGFLFDDWLNDHLYNYKTVAITLIVYGVLFILIENRNKNRISIVNNFNELSYKTAFLIGMFQVLSLIPGTSRSGSTILGAIILGSSRSVAAEYSFFLSIPIMFGASALKLFKFGLDFTGTEMLILLTGMAVAFFFFFIAIKFLMNYIQNNNFKAFGYYRIVLGVSVIGYFAIQ